MKPTPPHAPSSLNRTCYRTQPNWLHRRTSCVPAGTSVPMVRQTRGPTAPAYGHGALRAPKQHLPGRRCTPEPKICRTTIVPNHRLSSSFALPANVNSRISSTTWAGIVTAPVGRRGSSHLARPILLVAATSRIIFPLSRCNRPLPLLLLLSADRRTHRD